MNNLNPEIYVACLASYNNGVLYGKWINANQSSEDLQEEVSSLLSESPYPHAEEWAIHDHNDFGINIISECSSLEEVSEYARFIAEHGKLAIALLTYFGSDISYVETAIEEHYLGEYESKADFVESFTEETNPVPEQLAYYIDYKKMAYDYFINDFFSIEVDYKVHVFFRF